MTASHRRLRVRRRNGNAFMFTLVAMAVVTVLALLGWWTFGSGSGDDAPELITNYVSRGAYDFVVIEQGTVESANNVELRCEVRSRGGGGSERSSSGMGGGSVAIIDVVPEGTMVQPGDVVVELDSSALKLEEGTQQTRVNAQKATVVQAKNNLEAAIIARKEYDEGTFVSEEKKVLADLFKSQQDLKTANANLEAAKNLMAKGIATALQVEAAQFGLDNAGKQYEVVETQLRTLREFTRAKMLKQFDADIDSAKAKLDLESNSLQVEEDRLRDIQSQIGKCIIKAPAEGQVVYANEYDSWRGSSSAQFIVTPGAMVRERQVLIRLPNASDMQVKATVNEARVTLIRPGLPVTIRVDALKDEVIQGEVVRVNQYAEPSSYSSGTIKRYATFIKILDPPPGLRVGMNAEVRIHVERKQDALQVPVQALAEHKGHFFTIVNNGGRFETREIKISSTNDKVATIESGLNENDEVVMNPRAASGLLVLPDLPDPTPTHLADIPRGQAGPITLAAVTPGGLAPGAGAGPGGPGGAGEGGEGGKSGKKKGSFSPASLVTSYLASDANGDEKLSKEELATMDDRRREALANADTDGDGFLTRSELMSAAIQRMQKSGGGRGPGGGGGEGRPQGPAGGGE